MANKPFTKNRLVRLLDQKLTKSERKSLRGLFRSPINIPLETKPAELPKISIGSSEKGALGSFSQQLQARLLSQKRDLGVQRREAPHLYQELLQHPVKRRKVLVLNSVRYRSRPFCDYLLEKSLEACFRRPKEAIELAELAVAVARGLRTEDFGSAIINDIKARAYAYLANAYRVNTEVQKAEEALCIAEDLLEAGTGDLLEIARFDVLKGSLLGIQRRFEESLELFDRALRIYRLCGETKLEGRTLVKKAMYSSNADNPTEAVELLRTSLTMIDAEEDPRLALMASHNLTYNLDDLGRTDEAEQLLSESRPLYHEVGDRVSVWRLRWLEARIARSRDELVVAEEAFLEVRDAFVREGILLDVALVSLELAVVYAVQNRTAELQKLANELVPLFEATGLHREALATVILFQNAALQDNVTIELVRSTMSRLRNLGRSR